MAERVCPWWLGYLLALPIRKLMQDPETILSPYVRPGMIVLEPGPGMGFFTLEIARLVGATGRVIAVDIQPKMLSALLRRARRAGLSDRIETRMADASSLGVDDLAGQVDFALAFAMVHELPDEAHFFSQVARTLKPGGTVLLSEPTGHVNDAHFAAELELAARAGLEVRQRPSIRKSVSALLRKGDTA